MSGENTNQPEENGQRSFSDCNDIVRCKHCWHDTGIVLMSNPPQRQEICCNCGEIKTTHLQKLRVYHEEHGPFLPSI